MAKRQSVLDADQHLTFARHFGPLETTIAVYRPDEPLRIRPEFADVSNLDHDGKVWGENSRLRMHQLVDQLIAASVPHLIEPTSGQRAIGFHCHAATLLVPCVVPRVK